MKMTKQERLQAALHGEPVDRPPVALWRHFPGDDQDPAALAKSTLAFQRQYDFDFVKVTPASSYCVRDWGVQDRWTGNQEGTREYVEYPIRHAQDWLDLQPLDPTDGALGAQLRCLELVERALAGQTPFIQTIFSPISQLGYLAGKANVPVLLREHQDAVRVGLETITVTIERFIAEARKRDIAGIFYAVQHASYQVLEQGEYERYGVPLDHRVLRAADGLWLNVLHLHGNQVMFDPLADYPVQVFNWHDRETPPTLGEGKSLVKGAVLGGLRQWDTMLRGTVEDVRREALDAIQQTGGVRFILGTGCVTPITAPWSNLRAAREAVEGVAGGPTQERFY
jgi:uroporphyrinogen decarboxylase